MANYVKQIADTVATLLGGAAVGGGGDGGGCVGRKDKLKKEYISKRK